MAGARIQRLTPNSRAPAHLGLCRAGPGAREAIGGIHWALVVQTGPRRRRVPILSKVKLPGAHLGPRFGQVGPMWSMLGTSGAHVEPMLSLCWPMLGLCWPMLAPCWSMLALC